MASKKMPSSGGTAEAHTGADADTKPPLTQAYEAAKALDDLLESRLVPAAIECAQIAVGTAGLGESPPVATARSPDGPVESLVAQVFELSPDREFTINEVIAELKEADSAINENSVRFTMTELKRKAFIHHVRNQGHYQILKFTKPGEEKPFPKTPLLDKQPTKSALKASPADVSSDLVVLKEAAAVIARLQALVHRNQEILSHISKLRAVL